MDKISVTIDHNSIVAMDKKAAGDALSEKDREIAEAIEGVLALAVQGQVGIVVPAIAANERQQAGKEINDFARFRAKLDRLGIVPEKFSLPPMRLDMSFLGYSTLGYDSPAWYALERELKSIIHPMMDWDDTAQKNWLNRYCDVMTMFGHLKLNADLFITDDKKAFLSASKKLALLRLGANQIETASAGYGLLLNGSIPKALPLDMPKFDDERKCVYIPGDSYHHYRGWRREKGLPEL